MATDSTVLREYLVALGFKIDQPGVKKVDNVLGGFDKKALKLTKGLIGVATAAQAMVGTFAYQMEKLYYASKRVDSTAGSIKALEYGGSRVGVSADRMRGNLEALARNLRSNPGLQQLLNSLGVKVTGRDKADVLTDLVGQLKKMPFFVAEKYANLFGIDADDLFMMQEGLEDMKAAQAARKQMAADMGVDMEAAALAGKEYAGTWREILERVGLLKDKLSILLLPLFQKMADSTNQMLTDFTQMLNLDFDQFVDKVIDKLQGAKKGLLENSDAEMKRNFDKNQKGGVELSRESKQRLGLPLDEPSNMNTGRASERWVKNKYGQFMRWAGAAGWKSGNGDASSVDAAQDRGAFEKGGTGGTRTGSFSPIPGQAGGYRYNGAGAESGGGGGSAAFARLEQQYGLPAGMLDRVWKTESGRGKNLTGPETKYGTAKGHFQFLDATAKQYGMDKDGGRTDRDDLDKSSNAAARYLADLMKKYDGDAQKAVAAYNWGPGNLDKYGLGRAPKQTRDYIEKTAPSGGVNQTNYIEVNGVKEPDKAAAAVGEEIRRSNADIFRNQTARVQ